MKHEEFIEQVKKVSKAVGYDEQTADYIEQVIIRAIGNYREEMRLKGIGIGREDGGGYGKAHLEIEKKR